MNVKFKAAIAAALAFLLSPEARRLEVALGIGIYEAIRVALGNA